MLHSPTPEDRPGQDVVLDGLSLHLSELVWVARDPGIKVAVASEAIERVVRASDYVSRAVSERDGDQVIEYGITTGFGEFKDVHIGLSQVIELQRNLILSHATGIGSTCDADDPSNYFPAEVVRAALATDAGSDRWLSTLRGVLLDGSLLARPL